MTYSALPYKRHRFPPEVIQHTVRLYCRFNLRHRDIEDILARRGVLVTHESIRLWCNKLGSRCAHRLRRGHRGYGDTVFMDEVFVRIRGRQRYLWRAVDQDGEVVDVLPQERRDAASAKHSFRDVLVRLGSGPRTIVTGQAGRLRGRPPRAAAGGCARHPSVREQPGRAVAPADPGATSGHYRMLRQRAFASWDRAVAI